MNAIIRNLVILVAVVMTVLSINPKQASASVQDCASQEDCIALLQDTQISVYRKGVLKGVITGTNNDGTLSSNKGWIIATDSGSPDVYIYEVATGTTCTAQTPGGACEEGVVFIHPSDPLMNRAYLACPWTNEMAWITLDCSSVIMESTMGSEPRSATPYMDDKVLVLNRNTTETPATLFGHYGTTGVSWVTHLGQLFQPSKVRYWNNGVDPAKIFISDDDILYWQDTNEIPPGLPPVFYNLPAGSGAGSLAVNDEYVLAAPLNGVGVFLIEIADPTSHVTLDVTNPFDPIKGPSFVALSENTAFAVDGVNGGVKAFSFDGTLLYTINEPSVSSIAYIAPTLPPVCSNNLVEPGEACDGTDFDGLTCADYGFDGGALSCSVTCDTVFVSGCWSCGDGTLNPGETCDGTDLGGASCTAAGYEAGDVTCTDMCTADYSACYTCGNNLIEGAENCEGADLNGATCESIGFVAGSLTCSAGCMFDTSACHMCGNDVADAGETCDGTDVPGQICQTLGLGYTGGTIGCNSSCDAIDDSACYTCGDGVVNATEECDGENLNEQTCESLGLGSGTLSCFENCTWNYNGCSGVPAEYCGNGTTDPGEECDDGNRSNSDDCSETCRIIPPTCGFGGIDAGEACDGTDLGGATCQSLGYEAGVLYCGGDCQLRTNDCRFTSVPQNISLTLDSEPEPGELDSVLMAEYEALKGTLTYNCVSQNVNGDLVITTTEGSYCAVRAVVLNKSVEEKVFSFIHIPENPLDQETPVIRFYQDGTVAQNWGGHITAYQGLKVKTVLMQDRLYQVSQERIASMGMKFLGVHPQTQSRGRWLALNVGVGSTDLCLDDAGEVCAMFVPKQGQVIINLDALEDLSDLGWKPPKDGGGCSCSAGNNNSNSSLPVIFLMVAALLFVKRRRSLKK